MSTRIWDRILGCTVAASFLALFIAYKTGSYVAVVDITIAGIALCLAIGGVWIYATASEPLGEPDAETESETPAARALTPIEDVEAVWRSTDRANRSRVFQRIREASDADFEREWGTDLLALSDEIWRSLPRKTKRAWSR